MKFLDIEGVKQIKQYVDGKFVTIEDHNDTEQVTSAALNDLNNRTLALEESGSTDDGTKQRYVLGTSEEGVGDMNAYIASSIPDPQEGDIFIPYDTNKRFPITSQQTTISFDDYQQQGWPASTATFIQYLVREGRSDYLEIVSDSSGSYRFYGSDVASSEYQYPSVEITLTNSDLCDDGKYRQKFFTWVNGFMYLYYTGTTPNVTLSRCLYDQSGEGEYYNGEWINREGISTKTHERLVTAIMQDDTAYPSANAVYEELKNYSKTLEVYEKYTSDNSYDTTVKDSPLTFSYIANVSNSTTSIYFRCSTTSTTAKTVQVSTGDGTWTDKTPNVQDSDGTYYVLLGTLTQSSPILQVKGSNISYGDSTNYCKFHVDGPCYMYGDLISLVGGHTGTNNNDISDNVYNGNYTFPYMFKDEVNIYSHPTKQLYLITQRVAKNAYYGMFYGCENIVKSPIIDANTYNRNFSSRMFFNCPNMKIFLGGPQLSLDYYTKQGITNTGGHYSYIIGNFYNDADKLLGDIVCASYNSTRDISNGYGLVSDIVTKQNSILFEELRKYVIGDSSSAQFTLSPNKINNLGTLDNSTARVFILKEDNGTGIHHYFGTFDTTSTVPTFTWPTGLTGPGGSPPAILPNKHYEISVLNNIVAGMEV